MVFLSKRYLIPNGHFEINWPFRYHNWYSTIKLRQIHVRKILSTPRGLFLTITNLGVLYEINKSQIFPSIFAKLKFRSFFNETTSCIALMKVYQYYLIRDQWQVPGAHVHILSIGKAKFFSRSNVFHHHFYLPEDWSDNTGPNGYGVLNGLVPCLKCMELACWVLHGQFRLVYLFQVSKNDDEKCCFLLWFGFSIHR